MPVNCQSFFASNSHDIVNQAQGSNPLELEPLPHHQHARQDEEDGGLFPSFLITPGGRSRPYGRAGRRGQCPISGICAPKVRHSPDDLYGVSLEASWEIGTHLQTILELNATTYSVLNTKVSLPPPSTVPSNEQSALAPFFQLTKQVVSNRTTANNNTMGAQPFLPDGSAADPASIGVGVLIANLTGQDAGQVNYAGAATDQLDYLLNVVPKTSDGAISHRVSEVQLWYVACKQTTSKFSDLPQERLCLHGAALPGILWSHYKKPDFGRGVVQPN